MKSIPVFYSPKQSLDQIVSFSRSPNKPKLLAHFWTQQKYPVKFYDVSPVNQDMYKLAHSVEYVDGLFASKILNGFGTKDKNILETLPYLTGSVIAAGEHVLRSTAEKIAFSLSSGSHHAGYSSGGAFCTLNHNLTAAIYLKKKYKLNRVGVIDVDNHFGDGDQDIKNRLKLDWLQIYSFGKEGITKAHAEIWLTSFHSSCLGFENCDLVIVNCGVDPHLDDDLGGVLTTEQMKRRVAVIFETMKLFNIPTVVCLAGGYSKSKVGGIQPVLDLHTNSLNEIIKIYLRS